MAKVERFQRTVTERPMADATRRAAETPESMGVGLEAAKAQKALSIAAVGSAGERAAGIGLDIWARERERERKKANDLALLKASNTLDAWELQRMNDPQTGALNIHGEASFVLPGQIDQEFNQVADAVAAGLGTKDQKDAFAAMRARRGMDVAVTLRRHVAGEMQRHDAETTQGTINNAKQLAITNALDPRRASAELGKGLDAITGYAARNGIDPAVTADHIREFQSGVHVGVIKNLLAQEHTQSAKIYYEEAKGQIDATQIDDIERALRGGSVKAESQRAADAIVAQGGTLTEQRDKAKALKDPDVREAALALIDHESTVKDKAERDADEAISGRIFNTIDKTGSLRSILNTPDWIAAKPSVKAAARSYLHALTEGTGVKTDSGTLYDLLQLSSANPAKFTSLDLRDYMGKLSKEDFEQMARLQASTRKGDDKLEAGLFVSEKTQNDMADQALVSLGLPTTEAGQLKAGAPISDRVNTFRRAVRDNTRRLEVVTGKKATDADVQNIVDTLVKQVGVQQHWFSSNKPVYAFETEPGTAAAFIPAALRTQIDAALRAAGQPVDDAHRLTAYTRYLEAQRAR